ncbi:hypothetical protein [Fournierella sp.]|uniref:hypothetical protein n=1 Tax=Allofournierella sp. TaxID=1940256 RepID=UPI0025C0C304|nr:hypothetical protein [Fournierella sp.]
MLKKESAQLLQQLDARNPLRGASKSTLIVTCLTRVLQTLIGTAQVAAFGVIIWLGCGGLEWIYHKYPLPTVSVMFFALAALVSVEVIRWRDER